MDNTISTYQALDIINQTKGKFFSARFRKKDGEIREINCRTGVSCKLKGGKLAYQPLRHGLRLVYDVKVGDYRMINLDTLQSMKVSGCSYKVTQTK